MWRKANKVSALGNTSELNLVDLWVYLSSNVSIYEYIGDIEHEKKPQFSPIASVFTSIYFS